MITLQVGTIRDSIRLYTKNKRKIIYPLYIKDIEMVPAHLVLKKNSMILPRMFGGNRKMTRQLYPYC